jgi:transcriptional regulator CtsR
MIDMGYDSTKFTEESKYHLISTVKFSGFISLRIRGYKMNKNNKLLNNINSTESYIRYMVLKFLLKLILDLDMFNKNYQALYLLEKLITHLTIHGSR